MLCPFGLSLYRLAWWPAVRSHEPQNWRQRMRGCGAHVVGHQVPEAEVRVHLLDAQDAGLVAAARRGDRELVLARGAGGAALGLRELVEPEAQLAHEADVRLGVLRRLGVLVVDVEAEGG